MSLKGAVILVCISLAALGAVYVGYGVLAPKSPATEGPHIEAKGTIAYVIDGDTIYVDLTWVDRPREGVVVPKRESVRMGGGLDAPELGDPGGREATSFVMGLCPQGSEVGLDLDDLAVNKYGKPYRDGYYRLLAVVYVKIDNTWINVNAKLLRWGRESYPSHDWLRYRYYRSEFDPNEWLKNDYPYV